MQEAKKIAKQLHPLERKVLPFLKTYNSLSELIKVSGMQEVEANRALQWLESKGVIKTEPTINYIVKLSDNGLKYLKDGLPEKRFLQVIKNSILNLGEIKEKAKLNNEEINACIGMLRRLNLIETIKDKETKFKITKQGSKLLEEGLEEENILLKAEQKAKIEIFDNKEKKLIEELRKRNILRIDEVKNKKVELTSLG